MHDLLPHGLELGGHLPLHVQGCQLARVLVCLGHELGEEGPAVGEGEALRRALEPDLEGKDDGEEGVERFEVALVHGHGLAIRHGLLRAWVLHGERDGREDDEHLDDDLEDGVVHVLLVVRLGHGERVRLLVLAQALLRKAQYLAQRLAKRVVWREEHERSVRQPRSFLGGARPASTPEDAIHEEPPQLAQALGNAAVPVARNLD
mmetsp:Transcript_23621/g.73516  ORF Transcript_23621/g.73516 Transcript_23621/m.73516 type:complete len:205 (-) Transcript_23621:69-683(-)